MKNYDTVDFTDSEIKTLTIFEKKDKIQHSALDSFKKNNYKALIAAATGTGKSRVAILRCEEIININPFAKIIIIVPTQKLRDTNWRDEFEKWNCLKIYEKNVITCCYVSANKIENELFELVVLDEAHNVTENNSTFFNKNQCNTILGLTATPPKKGESKNILNILCPTTFVYTLDQGVKHGTVAPYEIIIIYTQLDENQRYIDVELKDKRKFKVTEKERYEFLCEGIEQTRTKLAELNEKVKSFEISDFFISQPDIVQDCLDMKKKEFEKSVSQYVNLNEDILLLLQDYKTNKGQLQFFENKHKFKMLERMRFIYNLESKRKAVHYFLQNFISDDSKTIIFCGSIKQADDLCGENVFHSNVKDTALNKFIKGEINYIGVVESLNEGHNIDDVDNEVVGQVNSNEKDIIQRIGRCIRFREDHIGSIFIFCCKDTQDKVWVEKSLKNLDQLRIAEINFDEL